MPKLFYIKERINPQFKKPYYVAKGQLTKKEAKRLEETLYGYNYVLSFETKEEYIAKITELIKNGFSVRNFNPEEFKLNQPIKE